MSSELAGADSVVAQLSDAAVDAARAALTTRHLRGLASLLLARGLKVVIRPPVMTVSSPAVRKIHARRDSAMEQVLTQSVLLRTTDDGMLWCWIRPAPPGHAPELEPLCAGEDIEQAANRIAEALAEKLAAAES